ncbi:hypothetical protein NDU88_004703 [Pleurodeles waltl]|uniref:Uncharacterized protein n=1 Tax=Pleurodeles waltl TaxID=8319 RepID=A0AAV7MU79_PLEWA|nr:hypothetical protein NDU88_004703 [Pleurodeles waltl]
MIWARGACSSQELPHLFMVEKACYDGARPSQLNFTREAHSVSPLDWRGESESCKAGEKTNEEVPDQCSLDTCQKSEKVDIVSAASVFQVYKLVLKVQQFPVPVRYDIELVFHGRKIVFHPRHIVLKAYSVGSDGPRFCRKV